MCGRTHDAVPMVTVCLDFDGVLNTYTKWQGEDMLYSPRAGVREFLFELNRVQGFKLVVNSTRPAEKIQAWLEQHDLDEYVAAVVDKKPVAFAYLDDRAVHFDGNYGTALFDILNLRVYWERNHEPAK